MNKDFRELARCAAHGTVPAGSPENYALVDVDKAFREELATYCSSIAMFMKNRFDLYEIITENADEITPKKVLDIFGSVAEIKYVGQGQRARFKMSNAKSKMRAKKFLTQVGLSGVYESFRLDSTEFEVSAHANGESIRVDFERVLDGAESLRELMDILAEGMADMVFVEIHKALRAVVDSPLMSATNKVTTSGFQGDKMLKVCNVVKNYAPGHTCAIFACPEFIDEMGPDAIVPGTDAYQGIYHPDDIDAIHNGGRIKLFRGNPVIELPQSFVDTNNNKTWLDPQLAYILPTGGEKIVKVVFEGNTQMYDEVGADQAVEMHAYRKLGVGIQTYYNFGVYKNSAITQTMYNPYENL